MKTIILTAIAVCLLIGALVFPMEKQQSVYAEQFGHQYYWGWRDGYYSWVFSAQTHDKYGWPNDDEGHPPNYWKGADAGIKYAQEHVMVKVVQGHVLTEYNATIGITDWFDGQNERLWGGVMPKSYSPEFAAGYNATYGTLPHEVDPQNLAQTFSQP